MQIGFDISENDFKWIKKWAKDGTDIPVYDALAKYIANAKVLPEEDKRKTGKWVLVHPLQEDDGGAYICSCCGTGSWEIDPARWKACPWCTALMEADDES